MNVQTVDRKFVKTFDLSEWEIETDEGWVDAVAIGKTIKYDVWQFQLENGLKLKCADDHIVFVKSGQKFVKDLTLNDKVVTKQGFSNVKSIIKLQTQEQMFDIQVNSNKHAYYTNDILSHNSTIAMIFLLWKAMFVENQIIAVLAHKADAAKDVLSRIKDAYEMLPSWMKAGVLIYNRMSIEFENGSKIFGNSTTKDAIRGKSCTYVYLDEFAHVPHNIAQEFWISNFPTVSTGGHIIIVSTPNGVGNLYHTLWKGAQVNKNNFNWEQVDWWEVPERDEQWKIDTIATLGSVILFNQEHGNKFIGSVETLIDHKVLEQLVGTFPIEEREDGTIIFLEPEPGHKYIIGVDSAEGKKQDYSVGMVFDITTIPWVQVAKYKSNTIALVDLPYKIKDLGEEYNDAWIAVESNNQGLSVLADLVYDIGYEYLVHMNKKRSDLGIFSHKKIRSDACALLKKTIENSWVIFKDDEAINQLMDFGPKAGKYQGLNGNDDIVMATIWAIYFNQSEMFAGDAKDNKIVYFDFKKGEEVIDNWDIIDTINHDNSESEIAEQIYSNINHNYSSWPEEEEELRNFLIN